MNIWTSDNIIKYWDGTGPNGKGEWVKRNGENAISIQPNNFHDGATVPILKNEFAANTQYIFSLWIDADDVVYNSNNVAGGMTVYYTDGTSDGLTVTGSSASPKGWQHKFLITSPTKTVSHMGSYYYTSIPVYYRWDSYVIPYHDSDINKQGVVNASNLLNNNTAAIQKGGAVFAENFYEV